VFPKRVDLDEGVVVEEVIDSLTRGEFPAVVLRFDSFLATAPLGFGFSFSKVLDTVIVAHAISLLPDRSISDSLRASEKSVIKLNHYFSYSISETGGVLSDGLLLAGVKNVTARQHNPFGFDAPCEPFVPGYGDANAHFHVIGDHPGVHGGTTSGVPFTDNAAGERLQRALVAAGLLAEAGTPPTVEKTYLSYLYMCGGDPPTDADYDDLEPLFDTELRAITAHVLLPVGERATRHVFANTTAEPTDSIDMAARHATEVVGSGWLVYPIREPAEWTDDDEDRLVDALTALLETDYRREADLGRFMPGEDPYLVR
jgi:uracil-DNA glycosylase